MKQQINLPYIRNYVETSRYFTDKGLFNSSAGKIERVTKLK